MEPAAPVFVSRHSINWKRLWLVAATGAFMWTFLPAVVPAPYHGIIGGILNAIGFGMSFAMRAGKYVEERNEIPPPGTI